MILDYFDESPVVELYASSVNIGKIFAVCSMSPKISWGWLFTGSL
jgi:hypothetical protein